MPDHRETNSFPVRSVESVTAALNEPDNGLVETALRLILQCILPHLRVTLLKLDMIARIASFGTSIFSEITALAREYNAVNLGQGFPDFDTPEHVKRAAKQAIDDGHNQYAVSHGEPVLRDAVVRHAKRFYDQDLDPDTQVCVTSGASEALWCAVFALVEEGDEVIVFEPAFDVYLPNIRMAGGVVKAVTLHAPDFRFTPDELRAAFTPKTKVIFVNTPHNPCGTVFNEEELSLIRDLCCEYDVVAICDEVYEHIVFEPHRHLRLATFSGMGERCITISSGGKTFSSTGWKCGWALGSADLILAIRRVHQFTVFAGATPFHHAIAYALDSDDAYFHQLRDDYTRRRSFLMKALDTAGLRYSIPEGSYFITVDVSALHQGDGVELSKKWIRDIGVAVIPSQKFYVHEDRGRHFVRLTFCKRDATLALAAERLAALAPVG